MPHIPEIYILIGSVFTIIFLTIYLFYRSGSEKCQEVNKIKKKFGLEGFCNPFTAIFDISGIYEGRELHIYQEVKGVREGRNILFTHIELASENSGEFSFFLRPDFSAIVSKLKIGGNFFEKLADGIKNRLKIQDLKIGNEEFDKEWIISSNNEKKLSLFFQEIMCDRVEKLKKISRYKNINSVSNFSIEVEKGVIKITIFEDLFDSLLISKIVKEVQEIVSEVELL